MFRGRKANLLKIVFWDGGRLCLFTKRLEQGAFLWPPEVERGRTLPLGRRTRERSARCAASVPVFHRTCRAKMFGSPHHRHQMKRSGVLRLEAQGGLGMSTVRCAK